MLNMKTELLLKNGLDGWCMLHRNTDQISSRTMHTHDELEINIGVSGKGCYLVDGCPVEVSSGVLLYLSPEQAHLLVEETTDFSMWMAVIRSERVNEFCIEDRFHTQLLPDDVLFLEELCRLLESEQSADLLNTGLRFLFLKCIALMKNATGRGGEFHPAVVRATRLLKRPEMAPDVDTIARVAGMSRSQLSRLFKKQTGFTLVEYRQKIQLEQFLFFYGNGSGHSIMEAALEVGFGSYAQFHRIFSSRFHCGPREYFKTGNSVRHATG